MKNPINVDSKRKHDLTLEEVTSCPLFAHFTDEQATEVVRTLKELTQIAYYEYLKERQKNEVY